MTLKQSAKNTLTVTFLAVAFIFSYSVPAQAVLMTYDYTGNPFTQISDPALGTSLTGSVQVDIPTDFTGTVAAASVISGSFTSGPITLDSSFLAPWSVLDFVNGAVTTWWIYLGGSPYLESYNYGGPGQDVVAYSTGFAWISNANADNPGIWTHAPQTPLPPAAWLFGSGLLGFIGLRRFSIS